MVDRLLCWACMLCWACVVRHALLSENMVGMLGLYYVIRAMLRVHPCRVVWCPHKSEHLVQQWHGCLPKELAARSHVRTDLDDMASSGFKLTLPPLSFLDSALRASNVSL